MSQIPGRLAAALADRYRIERELGQGGMATVYLAEDLKHKRRVAVKVLKPELAAVLGAERFVQEITTTAALQHPHILPLFDSGAADGFLYYVMPYIEGETLRSKLDREKQLGIEDAVRITRDVADALDYAHRRGVIHRDIKPENILLHDGRPMVADFGIALALSAAAGGRMTETGLSLGTPHYMSPEQATAEKDITARSDVYSLGSVLYEMLTGNPPHVGATAQQIIMKIVAEDARPVTQLRRSVPRNVAAAVRKAIEKLPGDRFESAAAFGAALGDVHYVDPAAKAAAVPLRQNRPALLMAGVAALAVLATGWSYVRRPRSASPRPLARLVVALPDSQPLTASAGRRIAFTPDGRAFVYVADGPAGTRLFLRPLDAIESTPIPGSEGATNPAFSPDGETIAFVAFGPFAIRTIPRAGGAATTIASGTNLVSGGGVDWGADGWIYFDGGTGITRIRPDGSGREVVAPMKPAEAAAWPTVLPNGRAVLLRVRRTGETEQQYTIEAADLRTRVRKTLVRALAARYDPAGYLLYVSARGELYAQRFDQDRVELRGAPVLLWSGLSVATFGATDVAISPSGAMLYTAGELGAGARRQVVWVSRDGTVSPVDSPAVAGLVNAVALSHDGTRIALDIPGATRVDGSDIWVKQLGGGPLSQVSRGGQNWSPSWSADDRSLLFMSDRDSAVALYRQRADGSNAAVREVAGLDVNAEYATASDGRTAVFRLNRGPGGGDLFSLHPGTDTAFTPLFPGPALERSPTLSPDGHWLAYTSDESSSGDVYVRPFPTVDSARIQVSTAGGGRPRWNHAGTELFFRSASNDLMSARRLPGPGMRFDRPVVLFNLRRVFQFTTRSWYDIAPDDKRFVMIEAGVGSEARRTDRLVFVDDIRPELARRMAR